MVNRIFDGEVHRTLKNCIDIHGGSGEIAGGRYVRAELPLRAGDHGQAGEDIALRVDQVKIDGSLAVGRGGGQRAGDLDAALSIARCADPQFRGVRDHDSDGRTGVLAVLNMEVRQLVVRVFLGRVGLEHVEIAGPDLDGIVFTGTWPNPPPGMVMVALLSLTMYSQPVGRLVS